MIKVLDQSLIILNVINTIKVGVTARYPEVQLVGGLF